MPDPETQYQPARPGFSELPAPRLVELRVHPTLHFAWPVLGRRSVMTAIQMLAVAAAGFAWAWGVDAVLDHLLQNSVIDWKSYRRWEHGLTNAAWVVSVIVILLIMMRGLRLGQREMLPLLLRHVGISRGMLCEYDVSYNESRAKVIVQPDLQAPREPLTNIGNKEYALLIPHDWGIELIGVRHRLRIPLEELSGGRIAWYFGRELRLYMRDAAVKTIILKLRCYGDQADIYGLSAGIAEIQAWLDEHRLG